MMQIFLLICTKTSQERERFDVLGNKADNCALWLIAFNEHKQTNNKFENVISTRRTTISIS